MRINQKIMIMREAITKIVPMLSQKDVSVTLRGMRAFVEFDPRTMEPVRVNLPYLPDDCSDELLDAVQGFLDHEVAHILFTDPVHIARAVARNKTVAFLQNALEDPMVEGMISDRFPGSAFNLANLKKFFLTKMVEKNLATALASADVAQITACLMVPAIRAWAGQREFIDFMSDKWPLIDTWVASVGADLIAEVPRCSSSEETCDLAIKIFDRTGMSPPPDQPEDKPDNKPDKGEPDNKPDKGEGEPDKGEPDNKPDKGEGEGEGESEKGEGESEKGEGEESEGEKPGDTGNLRPKMNSAMRDEVIAAVNKQLDFDASIAEALSARAQQESLNSEYLIFTRDDDSIFKIEPSQGAIDQVPRMQRAVDDMLGPLTNEIERMVKARSNAVWSGGHRTGRLSGSALTRVKFGRDDVFRRKHANVTKSTAVSLVCDVSGSMCMSGKIVTAMHSAYAVSSILDRLGIANEVIGFTTKSHSAQVQHDLRTDPRYGDYCRYQAINMPLFKGFGERMSGETRARFVEATIARGLCVANVDGESIQIAHQRLLARQEVRKIMLVFSDGQPAVSGGGNLDGHLKAVVKMIEASGTDIVGFGIMDRSVSKFYKKYVIMKSVQDLPAIVMGELKFMLTK